MRHRCVYPWPCVIVKGAEKSVDVRVGFGEGGDMSVAAALQLSRRHDSNKFVAR